MSSSSQKIELGDLLIRDNLVITQYSSIGTMYEDICVVTADVSVEASP